MRSSRTTTPWLLLSPFVLASMLLVVVPLVGTAAYAMTDASGLATPSFVGLDNLARAVDDPRFRRSLVSTGSLVLLAVPARILLAGGLALLLAEGGRATRATRAVVMLPTILPGITLTMFGLMLVNPVTGPIGRLADVLLGAPALSTPLGARSTVALLVVLPLGETFLVLLVARRSIPSELLEAAVVDGAGPYRRLRHVTVPIVVPVVALMTVRDISWVLHEATGPAYVLTDGGPDDATLFLPLYVFDQSFEFFRLGYGAMLSLLLLAVVAVVGLLVGSAVWWAPRSRRRGRSMTTNRRAGAEPLR